MVNPGYGLTQIDRGTPQSSWLRRVVRAIKQCTEQQRGVMEKLLGILESEIPFGGYGRRVTPAECARLREQGVACKETYIVVRAAVDTPRLGYLYEPAYTSAERFARVDLLVG